MNNVNVNTLATLRAAIADKSVNVITWDAGAPVLMIGQYDTLVIARSLTLVGLRARLTDDARRNEIIRVDAHDGTVG